MLGVVRAARTLEGVTFHATSCASDGVSKTDSKEMQGAEEGGLILLGNAEHGEDGGQGLIKDTRGADENDVDMV